MFDAATYNWNENVRYIDTREIPGSDPDFVSFIDTIEIEDYKLICHRLEINKDASELMKADVAIREVHHTHSLQRNTCPLCDCSVTDSIMCGVGNLNLRKLGEAVRVKRRGRLIKGIYTR